MMDPPHHLQTPMSWRIANCTPCNVTIPYDPSSLIIISQPQQSPDPTSPHTSPSPPSPPFSPLHTPATPCPIPQSAFSAFPRSFPTLPNSPSIPPSPSPSLPDPLLVPSVRRRRLWGYPGAGWALCRWRGRTGCVGLAAGLKAVGMKKGDAWIGSGGRRRIGGRAAKGGGLVGRWGGGGWWEMGGWRGWGTITDLVKAVLDLGQAVCHCV